MTQCNEVNLDWTLKQKKVLAEKLMEKVKTLVNKIVPIPILISGYTTCYY